MKSELQMSQEWRQDAHNSERERLEKIIEAKDAKIKELEELAYKDQLTGLWNRNGLEKLLEEKKYGRPDKTGQIDPKVSLLILDIDHFKKFNDEYGHSVGDEVLAVVAQALRESHFIRNSDIVARWGGEELVVVFEGHDEAGVLNRFFHTNKEEMENNREGRPRFNVPVLIEGKPQIITLSGGVTEFDTKNETYKDALMRADFALYKAKGKGLEPGEGRDRILGSEQVITQEAEQEEVVTK